MKTIVLANHKGGCAKTTTALNLAIVLASQGSRVLAVDLDPQGNLSVALGADLKELESTRVPWRCELNHAFSFKAYWSTSPSARATTFPATSRCCM